MARRARPRLAVWKFASCDGCQLTLLDCEDELLSLARQLDIAYFAEASRRMLRGPYDLSLVEGSITTPADAERVQRVRHLSRHLVTIGACATAGGIQALRNFADVREFAAAVYPTGCGAICPAYGRGCYGCFGPAETPNTAAIAREFFSLGMTERDIGRVFRTFNSAAEAFRKESEAHGE